ncbi:MAG: efflux RND transporter periplasmic adaptor subunit [Myxococcota bacterium]
MKHRRVGRGGLAVGTGLLAFAGFHQACSSDIQTATSVFRTAKVERRSILQQVEATGRLEPKGLVIVSAAVSGRIEAILAQPRMKVERGALLARLESSSLELEMRRAEATVSAARGSLSEARAALKEARAAATRAEALANRGQMSQAELEAASSRYAQARAGEDVARAQLIEAQKASAAAQLAFEQADIRAPRAGVVLTVPKAPGMAVGPAGPELFRVSAPLETLTLEAAVGEADIGQLNTGQKAHFDVQAYPGRRFEARVEDIGVVAETGQGVATYPVHLTVPNPEGDLLPGMSAAVRFEVGEAQDALAVPDAALRFQPVGAGEASPRSRVFVIASNGSVQEIRVNVGLSDGVWSQVTPLANEDLTEGQAVLIGYATTQPGGRPEFKIGG